MMPEKCDKIQQVGGVKGAMPETQQPFQVAVGMLKDKIMRRLVHQLHQLRRLAYNGRPVPPREDRCKEAGDLVSKKPYKDFVLRVEFWPSDDANSGIYFRCLDAKKITDRTCYEANIFDKRPDPSYGTGAITRYIEVDPMPKAVGKWNTYEVTAKGRDITVVLNGETTAKLRNGMFDEGPIALQHGAGAIKFRKVEVKPL